MAGEDLVCRGGAPARRETHGHHGADHTVTAGTIGRWSPCWRDEHSNVGLACLTETCVAHGQHLSEPVSEPIVMIR